MDGWNDEWMDGWNDEWIDEVMSGWMDGWMDGRMGKGRHKEIEKHSKHQLVAAARVLCLKMMDEEY